MDRFIVHYGIHILVPIAIGFLCYKEHRLKVTLILLAAFLIDLDHLLANPIFDPGRCSINFHPLHSYWAIGAYVGFLFFKRIRLIGIGLLIHILADFTDCLWL